MDTIKEHYDKRHNLSQELCRRFNNEAIKLRSLLRLRLTDDKIGSSFQIHYDLQDPLIDNEIHERGNAVIYPSDAARNLIISLAQELGQEVSWNNTATIGWFNL